MRRLRSAGGFTILEALAVLGIMGVVMLLAAPSITSMRDQTGIASVQREIMSTLYIARSSAIANNAQRKVVFTPPQLIQIKDQAGSTTFYTRSLSAYGSKLTIGGEAPITVTYDSRGLVYLGNTVTVTIKKGSLQSSTITVYPTGKAQIGAVTSG